MMKPYRHVILVFLSFLLVLVSNFSISGSISLGAAPVAQTDISLPTKLMPTESSTNSQVLVPDWERITFGTMPSIQESGNFKLPDSTVRAWQKGQTPDQYLTLGDIEEALRPDLASLASMAQAIGDADYNSIALDSFPLVGQQTLNHLAEIVPNLLQFPVSQMPPIEKLLSQNLIESKNSRLSSATFQDALAQNPSLGELKLNKIDLSPFSISSIPNLDSVQLGQFENWRNSPISQIPNLNALPLASFPLPISQLGNAVARIDAIWGKAEKRRVRTISGSDVVGFEYPCQDEECPYIELDDLENEGRQKSSLFEGRSWISGKSQKVEGGWGCLKSVGGGKEPTGRLPYGSALKVVVMETNERADTVNTAFYFRFCSPCGCTPYNIGPVPFLSYRVNAPIFIGSLDQNQMISASVPTNSVSPNSASSNAPFTNNSPTRSRRSPGAKSANGGNALEVVKGINVSTLGKAIARLQSSGSYDAIGAFVVAERGQNGGRALGAYQTMSFDPLVVSSVTSKTGGDAWLQSIARGQEPTTEELWQFFPPADQEAVFRQSLVNQIEATSLEIDSTTGQPFSGDRLSERVIQKYLGGDASKIDSNATDRFGRLTLKNYAQNILAQYKALNQ